MKKSLRILTVLSIAASSILFATPSHAAVIGGVTVTTAGNITATTLSGNSIYYTSNGGSYGVGNKITFDISGRQFELANLTEASYTNLIFSDTNRIGIPAVPVSGYDLTINMNMGYAYAARGDIYVSGTRVLRNLYPSTQGTDMGMRQTTRPFVQFNYLASTGEVSVLVAGSSSSGSVDTYINSDGTFSVANGTINSWLEVTKFTIGAPVSTAPGAPTSVTATSTGATTANVSFTAPASNGGATITSYTATSSPGGITGSISQAGSGTIAMTGLTAGTAYTFTVKATNSVGDSAASSPSNSINTVGVPSAPTSVVATATGKRSATVSFAAPASNGGSAVTSYTATSTPGGLTQTLTQATGGTFNFDGLQPGTAYTFAVTAKNAIGTSAATTSNSVTTTPLVVASLSSLSFVDDGTGTGGKIVWAGKSIDAVLYTGPANSYPGPYNYGAFSSGWNGRIRNLTPDTSYTVSIFAVSIDGVGESKSLTFKTSATLPASPGAVSSTTSQADQISTQLPKLFAWIDENVFVPGEGDRMKMMLNKFDAVAVPAHSAFLKLPNSSVARVSAASSTPAVCKVEGQLTVHSIVAGTCTISYTVTGGSRAPATLAKDFVFAKFAK